MLLLTPDPHCMYCPLDRLKRATSFTEFEYDDPYSPYPTKITDTVHACDEHDRKYSLRYKDGIVRLGEYFREVREGMR